MILKSGTETIGQKAIAFEKQFNHWLQDYLSTRPNIEHFVKILWDSKSYSLSSGGKRFRPFLASLIYQIWNKDLNLIKNFCLAIEMIHTYSLIHDDLPCMDNDDLRRGKPTNHKVFGEATALLAGDALLTEAFYLLSSDLDTSPEASIQIIRLLAEKIGSFGMVGGQVLDMNSTNMINLAQLEEIHLLKTAYLIQAAAVGGALLAGASTSDQQAVSDFSVNLGIAFQIKDDLLDANDKEQDHKSYLAVSGEIKTLAELKIKSAAARKYLDAINSTEMESLLELIDYNLQRTS